ncbi:BgTH12-00522 [Blumeria graminis f. sp. triticale]|uniref:Phenylalanine--tRNA ligase, mitochondrial n=1 Tax=Blumeria graminis f. sp. triticale TaxID=1689686 RepID=A0A9W4D659_BLUGR|nr:BgTH12-00522 [Blumeria graminis f. sp. triticale]
MQLRMILRRLPICFDTYSFSTKCNHAVFYKSGTGLEPRRSISSASGNTIVNGTSYPTDSWTNVSPKIASSTLRRLHLELDHPISITRSLIESCFPHPTFRYYNEFSPVVSVHQNFDSLGFPPNHPGRSKTDTYYINSTTLLRTHTSAHQTDVFRKNLSAGYLISADVYRRDAIDKSHYPIFHQMEGARTWERSGVHNKETISNIWKDFEKLPSHNMKVEDSTGFMHHERNPIQKTHLSEEVEAMTAHLKRSLELVIAEVFSRAKLGAPTESRLTDEPLRIRWVETYFPFTLPSWELEIFWQGDWLEVLGCGIVKQNILINADVPNRLGWAFGIGLERIAMLLFEIPDIRLFWCQDQRFLNQFEGLSQNINQIRRFKPFSKYPATYKDVSFWIIDGEVTKSSNLADRTHENDIMQVVRDIAGDVVEDVKKIDEFQHPRTGRISWCYRINYRSLEKTLTSAEANKLHDNVKSELVDRLGIELR